MKIKSVSTDQFAGLMDKSISFEDGINVVYGKNESGKSTLVNLIYNTLFTPSKLKSNSEFNKAFFPVNNEKRKVSYDTVDGTVKFTVADNIYKIQKSWGFDSFSKFREGDEPLVKNGDVIRERLHEILSYNESLYRDVVFSDQVKSIDALKKFLDSKENDTKKDLADVMAKTVSETDGISADAILKKVQEKIDDMSKRWNIEKDGPQKQGNGKNYVNGGAVWQSYFKLMNAQTNLNNFNQLKLNYDYLIAKYNSVQKRYEEKSDELKELNSSKSDIKRKNELNTLVSSLKNEKGRLFDDLKKWQESESDFKTLEFLLAEYENAYTVEKYKEAKKVSQKISEYDAELKALGEVDSADAQNSKALESKIKNLELKLRGMNIIANINLLNGSDVLVTSLATGNKIEVLGGIANIEEAVKIVVPDILEITLSPADVNVDEIKSEIDRMKKELSEILNKYRVKCADELKEQSDKISYLEIQIEKEQNKLNLIVSGSTFAEIEEKAKNIPTDIRSSEEVKLDINKVCAFDNAKNVKYASQENINNFKSKYTSVEELSNKITEKQNEITKNQDELDGIEIPEKLSTIRDIDSYINTVEAEAEAAETKRNDILKRKIQAEAEFEMQDEDALTDAKEKAEEELETKKAELKHWLHIKEVVVELKNSINANPMDDVADSFKKYLGIITDGKISTEFDDKEDGNVNVSVYTSDKSVDFDKLSEGSKETVALAFRLAVFDHLFPDGDGVIVFDDPFVNMDADRTEKSIELIKGFAKKNQVIFLTCKEEYKTLLQGNRIDI